MSMKFVKGMMIGSLVSAGLFMMYQEELSGMSKKKMIRKGKQFIKKMGMM